MIFRKTKSFVLIKLVFFYTSFLFFAVSCTDQDDNIVPIPRDVTVQNFMWRAMNLWYFWQAEVPDLADDRFSNDQAYVDFLKMESDPERFFFDKLLFSEDRFSFLSDDYKELTNSLSGISKSNGLEFGLTRIPDSDNVYGYVRYIIPNSDASSAAIQRGDLFVGVNGTLLFSDRNDQNNNNFDLLFGPNSDTYTLNMADIVDGEIIANGEEVTLTKEEGLAENPVYIVQSFDINGKKIGYLMYNGFTNEYDEDLNDAFGQLKTEGVTDLVLDLRYNSGGSVNSSRLLASMIYGTKTDELYIKQRWNDKIQSQLSASQLEDYFANKTGTGSTINSLNLNRVYVLTTRSSASASELVINGLDPYIEITQIGTTTRGKNEFSITMVDDPQNDYVYNRNREDKINVNNSWAIQPLVGRNENAVGFSDYTDGFVPDIVLPEDLANLGVLGDINEPLLARAIQEITGAVGKRDVIVKTPVELVTSSKMYSPLRNTMVLDKPLQLLPQ